MNGLGTRDRIHDYIKLNEFLNTRRNETTKQYSRLILDELGGHAHGVDIRSVLNKLVPSFIPTEGTFFRVLKDLADPKWGLIDRREDSSVVRRGKAPVFYTLKISLPWEKNELPNPQRDIENVLRELNNRSHIKGIKLEIAVKLLEKHSKLVEIENTINTIFKEVDPGFDWTLRDIPPMRRKISELTDNPPFQEKED